MPNNPKTGMSQIAQQVNWALKNSRGGMGGMAAMMGMPFQQKTGGQWMTFDPRRQSMYPSGTTPYRAAGQPTTGGEDPAYDPNNPNSPLPGDKFKLNLIPEWWKEWYRTQGQNGGVPRVDGLL